MLFQIDPAPYAAAEQKAEAALAVARANLQKAEAQSERTLALGKVQAVSEIDQINARASLAQARAEVKAAEAALVSARIDLDYAQVTAPITGRIGRALVTEGALVGRGEATHLATIRQIDPMYVSFSQAAAQALQWRADDESAPVKVHLVFDDGHRYPVAGEVLFSESSVDSNTGQVEFRARIANPEGKLLPGLFVRVEVAQAHYAAAYRIPQLALTRSEAGDTVKLVDADNRVVERAVTVVGQQGGDWIVTEGIEPGSQLMMDGFFMAPPGTEVIARPLTDDKLEQRLAGVH